MFRVPLILEKGGGIPHPGKTIMKVQGSKKVSMEELLDDMSKSK